MKVAVVDPPYIGLAHRYPEKREVDHAELIARLVRDYPDGWALCLHTPSLRTILPLCPADARVLAWVKPWCSFKPGVKLAYAWEPVILRGGRKRAAADLTVRDWVAVSATTRRGLVGAKPEAFCFWLFACLGLRPGDEMDDLYPGSGAVTRAWRRYCAQLPGLATAG
jgi:hypothetical protein